MTVVKDRKREKAEALIRKLDPSYRQRWEIYDGILKRLTGPEARWLDAGCGNNIALEEFPCAMNAGIDIYRHPDVLKSPPNFFVLGSLDSLPFKNRAFTLVTLNMVVEHIRSPEVVFGEIYRVLTPGGHVLVHTTNILSPLILFGKLLPDSLRKILFTGVLGAKERDIFPVYHKINTVGAFGRIKDFEVEEVYAVQDLNRTNRAVFLCLLACHIFTKLPGMWRLRTNIVVLLRKKLS